MRKSWTPIFGIRSVHSAKPLSSHTTLPRIWRKSSWKENGQAVACAAWKSHPDGQAEVKRVYVKPAYRHGGLARRLLEAVEARVAARGFTRLLLETNPSFTDAVQLYQRYGFQATEPFGPYVCLCTLCMAKPVRQEGEGA